MKNDTSKPGNTEKSPDGNADSTPSVDPQMVKVFEEAARYMEDTWKKAGSPTTWPMEKWDTITNGALSQMARLVILSVSKDDLVKYSEPILAEKAKLSGEGDSAKMDKPSVLPQPMVYDYLFKVVLTGDSGVGKTSVFSRYTRDHFDPQCMATIGVDFVSKLVNVEDKVVKAQIWDLSGLERFRPITTAYYRAALGFVLVYDITNRTTYDNISHWLASVRQYGGQPDCVLILVGNKSDVQEQRQVSTDEAETFATQNGMLFAEVSARNASNIESAFLTFLTHILRAHVGSSI